MIYADVLVSMNILLTYFFIAAARLILKMPVRKWSAVIASLAGGLSSLAIFIGDESFLLTLVMKLISGAVISFIAFFPRSIKAFFRCFLTFIGVAAAFGGLIYAFCLIPGNDRVTVKNGIVYFDVSVMLIAAAAAAVYVILSLADKFLLPRTVSREKCSVFILRGNRSVTLEGFPDSGNHARDVLGGYPVIIAELEKTKNLFSPEELCFIENGSSGEAPESLEKCFRLIPCSGISGSALLPAFVPDEITVKKNGKSFSPGKCTVALTEESLYDGTVSVLLNTDIFETGVFDV